MTLPAFIAPPRHIPLPLRGAGVMEALVADHAGRVDERMLKLVRMTVSSAVDCPFCVGFNGRDWEGHLSADELAVVQGRADAADVATLDKAERLAIEYALLLSATPIAVPREMRERLTEHFTEPEIVVLATTVAQVGYWARVAQGLGCPALG
jgi:alkylhydroperoxidase family enzyme